jgi:hypothetical protein
MATSSESRGSQAPIPLTEDPDLHLYVDGTRVDAGSQSGNAYVFPITGGVKVVRIRSRAAIPCEIGLSRDFRQLGVALSRIVVRQGTWFRQIDLKGLDLPNGFHAYEPDDCIRWTDGDAGVPMPLLNNPGCDWELILHVGGSTSYLDDGERQNAA